MKKTELEINEFCELYKEYINNSLDKEIRKIRKLDINELINEIDGFMIDDNRYYKAANKLIRDIKVLEYKKMLKYNVNRDIYQSLEELLNSIKERIIIDEYTLKEDYINYKEIDPIKLIDEFIYMIVFVNLDNMVKKDYNDYLSDYNLPNFWNTDFLYQEFGHIIFSSDIYYNIEVIKGNKKYVITSINEIEIWNRDKKPYGHIYGAINGYMDDIILDIDQIKEISKEHNIYVDIKGKSNKLIDRFYTCKKNYKNNKEIW